jgi:hypothetical protein
MYVFGCDMNILIIMSFHRFNPSTSIQTSDDDRDHTTINCSALVMWDGKSHISGDLSCHLVCSHSTCVFKDSTTSYLIQCLCSYIIVRND